MFDITPIVEALISICVFVITTILIPFLGNKYKALKASNAKIATLDLQKYIDVAVNAAEQIYKSTGLEKRGQEKKEYVINQINSYLSSHNMTVDAEEINMMIESAVLQVNISYASTWD